MIPIQQLPKSPTRKCFEEAFLELYAQKPLDQISVMALTEKAGYSRATFYRNYYSISNVLESVEEENTCTSTCQAIISCLDDITLEQATDTMADFYQKRFREVSILANGEYGSIYLDKQREPMNSCSPHCWIGALSFLLSSLMLFRSTSLRRKWACFGFG